MHAIHANARTTPTVRAEIARSTEPTGVLAQRYGVSTETIRKWRKRVQPIARTTRAARISCPGKQRKKSGPLSVRCDGRRVFL